MILFVVLLALLCLYQIRFSFTGKGKQTAQNQIFTDYNSLEKTTSIKGIFILIVFLNHAASYLQLSDSFVNTLYFSFIGIIGQAMVAMFLFYSGYGVMLSIDKKGAAYVKSIPSKRAGKVLVNFDIAVLLFLIVQTVLGNTFPLKTILFAFIGWEAVGNSNWYIFDILVLYLLTYCAFLIAGKRKKLGIALTAGFTALFIVFLYVFKDSWWYDTVLCYPLGMLYYASKDRIEALLAKHKVNYYLVLLAVAVLFVMAHKLMDYPVFMIINNLCFSLLVVLLTMKVSLHNKILHFFGKHLFSVYILQRLPMLVFAHLGVTNQYLFVVLSFAVTVLLAVLFDDGIGKLWKKIEKTRRS